MLFLSKNLETLTPTIKMLLGAQRYKLDKVPAKVTTAISSLPSDAAPPRGWQALAPWIGLAIGLAALIIPTFLKIAQVSWSTEQGTHGPIVLAIAIWLFWRRSVELRGQEDPGSPLVGVALLVLALLGYVATGIVGSVTLQSGAMYVALLATLYLLVGASWMGRAWFPIAYFLFVLPPPGSWVAAATQPLRLQISEHAVDLLSVFGYPVARSGLLIYAGQYMLEVKAACGGLNSMISLSAIGLFYAYIRHNANVRYMLVLSAVILIMAVLANFIRVIALILITYHLGDAAAQGFLHDFAGLVMFSVAMLGMLAFDAVARPLRNALARPQ